MRHLAGALLIFVVACSNDVSTVRMGGVFPARPADCRLELRNETMSYSLTSTYDTVGMVRIRGQAGEAPNSPRLLGLLKPEACGLGGEIVLVGTSANVTYPGTLRSDDSYHSYLVMRRKSEHGATSQTF